MYNIIFWLKYNFSQYIPEIANIVTPFFWLEYINNIHLIFRKKYPSISFILIDPCQGVSEI